MDWEDRPKTAGHAPPAADLRLYLLGPPRVEWAGHPLTIPRRQVRALLYYLAAHRQPVPRERLCFLFWSDTPESQARRNLSHLLTHLRRALPDPTLLLASGERAGLNPTRTWSDVTAFEQLCAASPPAHQRALALYRGPFLAGLSLSDSPEFENWAVLKQHACERLYLEALVALSEELMVRGEYEQAIACARRYLDTDDLAEDVHRRLIELYALAGERSAALRQFERCAAILERELGIGPLPETRAVYRAILEGRTLVSKRPAVRPTWATLPGPDVPLVGRDEALHRLEEVHTRARAGRGQFLLIAGEAGIGKSRLMQDFATRLQGQALILVGTGQSGDQTLPYHPVAQALRGALEIEHPALDRVPPIWLAEAARLLPQLRARHPDLPSPLSVEPEEARTRLFEALCQLTLELSIGPQPLLLCLDDLHWADRTTLDWLVCLAHRMTRHPILVLGTYRTEEQRAVDDLRHNLLRLGVLSELRLTGLDSGSVLQLLHHLTGPLPRDEVLVHRLQEATSGNPFFIMEILRALIEANRLRDDLSDLRELPLPETVHQAVRARLRRLSPQARQVLEASAILGDSFDFDLVHLTAGRPEMEAIDALDELVARQLMVEQPPGYRFQHELTRQTVEAGLSPVRRQLLHRRAARALERLEPNAVAIVARHFGLGGEAEDALRYYAQAVEQAEALFAWREAERYQGHMLALLDQLDPDCASPACLAQRGEILTARAHAHFLQGRLADRDADLAALAGLAERTEDDALRLQTLVHHVRYLNLDAKYEEAIKVAEEGLALADLLHRDETESRLLAQIGFARYFLGQPQAALTALESALAVAGEEADPAMRGRITHILGYVYFHLGDYARSLSYQREAQACHQAVGDHNRMAWDGLDIGALHLELGHFAEAQEHLIEHLALARRIGARPAEAYGLTLLGCWELHRGNYTAATDRFQQALSIQQELRSAHGSVAAGLGMGLALYHLGNLNEARRRLERAVELARSIAHRRRLVEALVGLSLVEIADEHTLAAQQYLIEAVVLARDSQCWENLAAGLAALARAKRQEGDPVSALDHAREAVRIAQESALPVCEMWGELEIGLAMLAQGEPASAPEHTWRAVTLLPQVHEGWIGTEEAHHAHARALRALGRTEEANEQDHLADAIVEAKANRIPDTDHRQHYLQFTHSLSR